jgi:hypothetical protein
MLVLEDLLCKLKIKIFHYHKKIFFFQIYFKCSAWAQKQVSAVCCKGVKLWYEERFPWFSQPFESLPRNKSLVKVVFHSSVTPQHREPEYHSLLTLT